MVDLFSLSDLAAAAQQDLDTASATVARNMAAGWLGAATRLGSWPDPVPADLSAWALELALLWLDNPTANHSESLDDYSRTKIDGQRAVILREARRAYGVAGATTIPLA